MPGPRKVTTLFCAVGLGVVMSSMTPQKQCQCMICTIPYTLDTVINFLVINNIKLGHGILSSTQVHPILDGVDSIHTYPFKEYFIKHEVALGVNIAISRQ